MIDTFNPSSGVQVFGLIRGQVDSSPSAGRDPMGLYSFSYQNMRIKPFVALPAKLVVTLAMSRIFRLTHIAPLQDPVHSRESCTYLYRAMKLVGFVPPEQGIMRYIYFIWSGFIVISSMLYVPFGFGLSIAKELKYLTPGEFLGVIQIAINSAGASIKAIILLILISRIHQSRLILDKMDERFQSDKDRGKIHKAVAQCNLIFVTYGKLYFSYTIVVFFAGISAGQPPWRLFIPFLDWQKGWLYFWIQSLIEYIVMSLVVAINLVLDTYTLIFIIILRAYLEALKEHICELRSDLVKTEAENYEELVKNIIDHQLTLQYSNLLRPVISLTIFVQFLLIGLVLGVATINLFYFSDLFNGIATLVYLTGILVETFPFCYLCDLLSRDCEELSNLLGQSQWIDAEPKYKTTLRIFMQHLQQPIIFIAGGVFPISMNSNIKVAKFAFSVFTIVRQMNLADRFK